MHDESSNASAEKGPLQGSQDGCGIEPAVRQFFQPYVLAFVALAIAVGGWSYGYKLSQYFHHSGVSRVSYSRVWVDHRDNSIVVLSQHRVLPDKLLGLEQPTGPAPRDARPSHELVLVESTPSIEAYLFSALIPLRAPPTTHLLLA